MEYKLRVLYKLLISTFINSVLHQYFTLAHKMSCIVAMEGFYVSGKYVAKELTIMFDENNYQHFMFDQPID